MTAKKKGRKAVANELAILLCGMQELHEDAMRLFCDFYREYDDATNKHGASVWPSDDALGEALDFAFSNYDGIEAALRSLHTCLNNHSPFSHVPSSLFLKERLRHEYDSEMDGVE